MIILELLTWVFFALIAYTYIGYPFLLWLLQRIAPKPIQSAEVFPSISLIIPTFNEEDVIRRKIENSLALDYPKDKLQIMIIDDDSQDATIPIIEEYRAQGVELIRKPQRSGKMASLQMGVGAAKGEIIVMSDASPSYDADALRQLVKPMNDAKIGIVVGTLAVWDSKNAVAKPAGLYWKYEAAIRRWESKIGSTVAMHGNLYAIRKTIFPKLESSTINDEWSISMRVIQQGFRVVYEPKAISYDDVSAKMGDEFKRRVRINAGRYQAFFGSQKLWPWNAPMVIFQIISHKFFRLVLPFFMIGALVFNVLALITTSPSPLLIMTMVLQVLAYGLAFYGYRAETQGGSFKLANLAYYLTSSNIAAFYGFLRYLRNRQSVMWDKSQRDVTLAEH